MFKWKIKIIHLFFFFFYYYYYYILYLTLNKMFVMLFLLWVPIWGCRCAVKPIFFPLHPAGFQCVVVLIIKITLWINIWHIQHLYKSIIYQLLLDGRSQIVHIGIIPCIILVTIGGRCCSCYSRRLWPSTIETCSRRCNWTTINSGWRPNWITITIAGKWS